MVPVCFNKFFRLPLCLGKNSIILNSGKNSVSSIQFHTHKLLQTWVLKQPHQFSCPAAYCEKRDVLICVMNKKTLITWDYDVDNLDSSTKIKFHEGIFAVLSTREHQIVVFSSGCCLLLDEAVAQHEYLTKSYLNKGEELVWADASSCESSIHVFLFVRLQNGSYKLHIFRLNPMDGQIEKSDEQDISRQSVTLQSWCIQSSDQDVSFLTIWSDGLVYSYEERDDSFTHLLSVPGITTKEQLVVEVLDRYHIVIVRSNSSGQNSFEIWDTRYATKKFNKPLDCVLSANFQAKVLAKTLFLPFNQSIVAEPLNVAFSTLAAVVGKSINDAEENEDVLYSWTVDGRLDEDSVEEPASSNISNKFAIITKNELFKELLKRLHKENLEAVSSCLKEIKLISESKLVKLLKHLLREYYPEFSTEENSIGISSEKLMQASKYFVEFFSIAYNDIFLQQHLRKLTFNEAVATLRILSCLLMEDVSIVKSQNTNQHYQQAEQIVCWISSLVLSHFEEFLLSVDNEMPVIKNVCDQIDKFLSEDDTLWIQHQKINFEIPTCQDYCIESLRL